MNKECKKSLSIILFILLALSNLIGQWFQSGVGYFDFNNDRLKPNISFTSLDTGYISYSLYYQDSSFYYQTVDTGRGWSIIDTIANYRINDMEYKYGWGLSCGRSGENAAMELLNQQFDDRTMTHFNDFKDFLQIEIVDSSNAVLLGIANDSSYCIGLVEKESEQIQVVKNNNINKGKIDKIDFFTDSSGWYLCQGKLYYTENLGKSASVSVLDIIDFDFFSIDTGIYIYYISSDLINVYKTFNRGISWEYALDNNISTFYDGSVMNSSQSMYLMTSWQGTSSESWIFSIDLKNGIKYYDSFYNNSHFNAWDLYFYSKTQGYFANNNGGLLSTTNNGGYSAIKSPYFGENCISIYPNPAYDIIRIDYPDHLRNLEKQIRIHDISGRIFKESFVHPQVDNSVLDISGLEIGIYFITISIQNYPFIQKIVIL